MTERRPPAPNAFEGDKAGTADRSRAESAIDALREKGGVFVEAVRKTRMPMVVTDPRLPGNPIVFANQSFLDLSGYSMAEVLGQQPYFMNGPGTDSSDAERFREALARGEDVLVETLLYNKAGREMCVSVYLTALVDEQGQTYAQFLSYLDITARFEAQRTSAIQAAELADRYQERERALHESDLRFSLIVESARDYAIFTTDPKGRINRWPGGAETVFGWTSEEAIGKHFAMTFLPEDRDAGVPGAELDEAKRTGRAPDVRWHLRSDGGRVFIDGTTTALRDDENGLIGYLKIGQDVTERHRAEERRKLLLSELQHRVRNTLAVVRSVARRTAQRSATVEEMGAHLEGRIDAFARVQAVVTRKPEAGVDLCALIEDELLVHATREGDRLRIKGPDVALSIKSAETMSLAIHELTTNAVKYGALAGETGRISVRWTIVQGRLELVWEETGLETPVVEPEQEGFGLELLLRVLPYELDAATAVDFLPAGLRFTLSMPVERNLHLGAPPLLQEQTDR